MEVEKDVDSFYVMELTKESENFNKMEIFPQKKMKKEEVIIKYDTFKSMEEVQSYLEDQYGDNETDNIDINHPLKETKTGNLTEGERREWDEYFNQHSISK